VLCMGLKRYSDYSPINKQHNGLVFIIETECVGFDIFLRFGKDSVLMGYDVVY
jgi:hypothetical protein